MSKPASTPAPNLITIHIETPDAFVKGTIGEFVDFQVRGKASVLIPAFTSAWEQVSKLLAPQPVVGTEPGHRDSASVPQADRADLRHVKAFGHEGYIAPMRVGRCAVVQPLTAKESRSFKQALNKAAKKFPVPKVLMEGLKTESSNVQADGKTARTTKGEVRVKDLRKAAPTTKARKA